MISFPSYAIEQFDLVGVGGGAGLVLDLLVQTLGLERLGLGTTSLGLVGDLLLHGGLALLLVDGLDEHTLVLEDVTLALHVQGVVEVLVDLLGVAVLLEKTAKHTKASHPDDSSRHAGVL